MTHCWAIFFLLILFSKPEYERYIYSGTQSYSSFSNISFLFFWIYSLHIHCEALSQMRHINYIAWNKILFFTATEYICAQYKVIKGNLDLSFCLKIIWNTNKCRTVIFMIFSCTGHLRINTLATIKQHSEKYVDYIGAFIANHKNKNLKFLRHKRIQLNLK